MDGSLNIEYHVRRLIVIALSKYKNHKEQAKALGIAPRTLTNYKKRYNL